MTRRFAIRRDPIWRPLLALFGGTAGGSFVEVRDDAVRVRFGLGFDTTVPRAEIAEAAPTRYPLLGGIGWRTNLRGGVALVGSTRGVVRLRLAAPCRARLFGFPLRCRDLYVSLEEPEAFLAALNATR